MKNRYAELIDQTFYFPQEGFELREGYLQFHGVDIKALIQEYGTPLKLFYLPKIGQQIQRARGWFEAAIAQHDYQGKYHYCYCTKSSHFKYLLDEVLRHDVNLETSSAYDIDLIRRLYEQGKIDKGIVLVHNGYKPRQYLDNICGLIREGFDSVIPVLDNTEELQHYLDGLPGGTQLGIRVATDEEPNFEFYTSRLGIRSSRVLRFYKEQLAERAELFPVRMLHFFVDTGIKDTLYYWNEFKKCIKLYCDLRKLCPTLDSINIGGGMPIKNSLGFEYDYQYMITEIVGIIKAACAEDGIPEPDIYTEFGKFTVGESGATIFSVIGQKRQNDAEIWYMIDNSLMNTIPDTWGLSERFLLLPLNKWDNEYTRVNLGGITCDNSDYYNAETHITQLYMPRIGTDEAEPLYLGFFHTGAYQEALAGYGGVQHCLIPLPKIVVLDRDADGTLTHRLHAPAQTADEMLALLGY